MKDYFDRDLIVGDEVAFLAPGKELKTGFVVSFTEKQVKIEYPHGWKPNIPDYIHRPSNWVIKKNLK